MRGCVILSARASSLTGRSRPFRRARIRRRCGSATALNASDVVAARAIGQIYVHIGICQDDGERSAMDLTNDRYVIVISFKSSTERYYRDKKGWVKGSTRGRKVRATAEQVLDHVLPPPAGGKTNGTTRVGQKEAARGGSG